MGNIESMEADRRSSRPVVFLVRDGTQQQIVTAVPDVGTMFGQYPVDTRRARPRFIPELQKTSLVKNPTHVAPDSLFITTENGNTHLEFRFDSTCPATVSVSMLKSDGHSTMTAETYEEFVVAADDPIVFPSKTFPAGLGQHYSVSLGSTLDVENRVGDEQLHLLVELTVDESVGTVVRGQKTYVCVDRNENPLRRISDPARASSLYAKVVGQTLDIARNSGSSKVSSHRESGVDDSTLYKVQEVFGMKADADADIGRECIICLSEPRDTVILPCRHMAFCKQCADMVRIRCENCPTCRQPVASLLQFSRQSMYAGAISRL